MAAFRYPGPLDVIIPPLAGRYNLPSPPPPPRNSFPVGPIQPKTPQPTNPPVTQPPPDLPPKPIIPVGPLDGMTWLRMFGREYKDQPYKKVDPVTGEVTDDPINLSKDGKRNWAPLCPMIQSLQKLMATSPVKPKSAMQVTGNGTITPHNVGAAGDIFYDVGADRTRAYAHGLISLLIAHRKKLLWGVVMYNHMEFHANDIGKIPDTSDQHTDHIHVDWIDYGRTKFEKSPPSFDYIDERGTPMTKILKPWDQAVEMYWNSGARNGDMTAFSAGFADLNRDFDANMTKLAALKLDDFKAMYTKP